MEKLDSSCIYESGDGTCFRPECPKSCVRNWRDQVVTDVPVVATSPRPRAQHRAWTFASLRMFKRVASVSL